MKPIGPLMIEHRLIERILSLIGKEVAMAKDKRKIEIAFLESAVDFIRWYADKTHHAKEEAILFREVAKKDMSPADRALMEELISDHDFGRRTVRQLVEGKEAYLQGSRESLAAILEKYEALVAFYQGHINKEDHIFFPASMKYFSEQEQEAMLHEFWDSDRRMIHAKYENLVELYERKE